MHQVLEWKKAGSKHNENGDVFYDVEDHAGSDEACASTTVRGFLARGPRARALRRQFPVQSSMSVRSAGQYREECAGSAYASRPVAGSRRRLMIGFVSNLTHFRSRAERRGRCSAPLVCAARRRVQLWACHEDEAARASAPRTDTSDSASSASLKPPVPYGSMLERERSERPGNAVVLGLRNFFRESRAIALDVYDRLRGVDERQRLPGALGLTLNDDAIAERERRRDADTGYLSHAPWISRAPYQLACRFLDLAFPNRPIARFWFLETVARMPYFSYLSVLHLYETFNWLHVAELRRTHFAEEWNELHHLLIMSALGGDAKWSDRFLAYHLSIVYYWLLVVLYIVSPRLSYNFSELLEKHAVDTYSQFLVENEARLRTLPAPDIAIRYYKNDAAYAFGNFGFTNGPTTEVSRPPVTTLYDVFQNICLDEEEHVKTMEACQNYDLVAQLTSSPYLREPFDQDGMSEPHTGAEEKLPSDDRNRDGWNRWAETVNRAKRQRAPETRRDDSDPTR